MKSVRKFLQFINPVKETHWLGGERDYKGYSIPIRIPIYKKRIR